LTANAATEITSCLPEEEGFVLQTLLRCILYMPSKTALYASVAVRISNTHRGFGSKLVNVRLAHEIDELSRILHDTFTYSGSFNCGF
jgi:hypothetical protein